MNIVITGTTSGLGEMLAKYYLELGDSVIGISRGGPTLFSKNYSHYQCNISDEINLKKVFFDIRKKFTSIDVLINNAASLTPFSSVLIPSARVREMIETNFYGLFLVSRETVKFMSGSGFGRIVNISSMAELLQPVGDAIYTATKSAATSIAQSFSKEFAASGITCNTLAITYLPTPMSNKLNQMHVSKAIQSLPLKSGIDLEDITNVINFYIDKKSSSITGQYLALGGLHR